MTWALRFSASVGTTVILFSNNRCRRLSVDGGAGPVSFAVNVIVGLGSAAMRCRVGAVDVGAEGKEFGGEEEGQ